MSLGRVTHPHWSTFWKVIKGEHLKRITLLVTFSDKDNSWIICLIKGYFFTYYNVIIKFIITSWTGARTPSWAIQFRTNMSNLLSSSLMARTMVIDWPILNQTKLITFYACLFHIHIYWLINIAQKKSLPWRALTLQMPMGLFQPVQTCSIYYIFLSIDNKA